MLRQIAEILACCQGHIRLVKVKSLMGIPLNTEADKLADASLAEEVATPEIDPAATMPLSFRTRLPPLERPQSSFTRTRLEEKKTQEGMEKDNQTHSSAEAAETNDAKSLLL